MGRKYGSLHILCQNEIAVESIEERYNGIIASKSATADPVKASRNLGLDFSGEEASVMRFMAKLFLQKRRKPNILSHGGYISIYDDFLNFQNVEIVAAKLSNFLLGAVLFASVYDDDAYIFGICKKGELILKHVSGECEAYGLTKQRIDSDCLADFLKAAPAKRIVDFANLDDTSFEEALSSSLGFSLNL